MHTGYFDTAYHINSWFNTGGAILELNDLINIMELKAFEYANIRNLAPSWRGNFRALEHNNARAYLHILDKNLTQTIDMTAHAISPHRSKCKEIRDYLKENGLENGNVHQQMLDHLGINAESPAYSQVYITVDRNFASVKNFFFRGNSDWKIIELGDEDTPSPFNAEETFIAEHKERHIRALYTTSTRQDQFRQWLALLPGFLHPILKPELMQDVAFLGIVLDMANTSTGITAETKEYNYQKKILAYLDSPELRRAQFAQVLKEFPVQQQSRIKTQLENDIQSTKERIQSKRVELADMRVKLTQYEHRLAGIMYLDPKLLDDDDIKMILDLKGIHSISYDQQNQLIKTVWRTPLVSTDLEAYQGYIRSSRNNVFKEDKMRRIFDAIFVNKTHSITCESALHFNMNTQEVYATTDFEQANLPEILKHPHLVNHTCMGSASTAIEDAMRQGDFVTMFFQAAYACGQLNIDDSTVIRSFKDNIHHKGDSKFIKDLATNTYISIDELPAPNPID